MNKSRYRAYILVALVLAALGIWCLSAKPEEERAPFAGAALVTVTGL